MLAYVKKWLFGAVCALSFVSVTSWSAPEDRTIWLQAGQCIVVGSQQVCAEKSDTTETVAKDANKQKHVCKDGIQDEADPNLRGWAHVIMTFAPNGKKISQETVKTYGPLGKKECEAELAGKK